MGKIILITFGSICFILVLSILSRLIYHRSLMATLVEYYLRITEKRFDDQTVIEDLKKLPLVNDRKIIIPKSVKISVTLKEKDLFGIQTFIFNKIEDNQKAIIYLHGAGYVRNPRTWHFRFVNKLAKKTNATIFMPLYPKAPNHNYVESYEKITKLYLEIKAKFKKVVLMGDSSGGGLALGLAEDFLLKNIPQPDEIILLSPWVDITLSNSKIQKYQRYDPIVFASNERIWGKSWAGDLNLKDYKVSPLYGNMMGLKSISIFVGTREILYPDIKLLESILKDNKVKIQTFIGRGLNHVYPIYPIPEARTALNQISNIINR